MQYYYYSFFAPKIKLLKSASIFYWPQNLTPKEFVCIFLPPKIKLLKSLRAMMVVIIAEKIYCKRGMFIFSANSLPSYPHESPKFVNIKLM